ncbi:G8 domain-containing protein [Natrinema salaciae]|uniref:G8 domain-containing protein n=1 Tax=Natrinema salaciae TaxID=1186196 RepID=A0A1H9G7D7_9EURY|nr:G8 domain-containing protein [Natrinema salaciae]SEQ45974.1 G8 domain-containing protein [Natrinema salaciae]
MTDGDDASDRDGATERRTLLKGIGLGAVGTGTLGAGLRYRGRLLGAAESAETASVAELVPESEVTHRATGGRWTAASAWEDDVPDDGADVQIPAETTVTVDHESDARLRTIRIDGTLRFDPTADTHLAADTIVVMGSGRLEAGTADEPIGGDPEGGSAAITFTDRAPIDTDWDPDRHSRGLLALEGATVRMHGAETTPFTALAEPPERGDAALRLAERPTGWHAGDRLVVAGVNPDRDEDERVTVAGIDGSTVELEASLEYDHVPPRDDLETYVAHLERPIRFQSETDRIPRRGHVMFMSRDVTVRGVEFRELGRTDKSRPVTNPDNGVPPEDAEPNPKARYACHFHRTGTETDRDPAVVDGCVVQGSPGWGFVNHRSYVHFTNNVSYRVFGSGFVAEVGTETGRFEGNFALRSRGTGRLTDHRQFHEDREGAIDDFGHGGYGFWFQGPAVAVEDNVAAGHRHFGFVYWTRAKPDATVPANEIGGVTGVRANLPLEHVDGQPELKRSDRVEDGMVPSSYVALRSFRNNTVFASGGGLDVSRHQFGNHHDRVEEYSVVEDFTAYNIGGLTSAWGSLRVPNHGGGQGGANGISIRYSANVALRDVRLIAGDGDARGVGINRNHAPVNVRLEGGEIAGWTVGVRAPSRGECPIRGVAFDNWIDVQTVDGMDRKWTPARRIEIDDCSFEDGGREQVHAGAHLERDLYALFRPDGGVSVDGDELAAPVQAPAFEPYPTDDDLAAVEPSGDALSELTDVDPAALVGESNRALHEAYGISAGGTLATATTASRPTSEDGIVARVVSARGSISQRGRLRRGERSYVYDETAFRAVPGTYAGLEYVRPEREDHQGERRSFLGLELTAPATVYVAYDDEVDPPTWLADWTDTGDTLGTDDGTRRIYAREFDAGTAWLGGCPNTHRMYTPFVEPV